MQCKHIKDDGSQCKNNTRNDWGLCSVHSAAPAFNTRHALFSTRMSDEESRFVKGVIDEDPNEYLQILRANAALVIRRVNILIQDIEDGEHTGLILERIESNETPNGVVEKRVNERIPVLDHLNRFLTRATHIESQIDSNLMGTTVRKEKNLKIELMRKQLDILEDPKAGDAITYVEMAKKIEELEMTEDGTDQYSLLAKIK